MSRCTHTSKCKREGKVTHECLVEGCGRVNTVCNLHSSAALRSLQDHVRMAHPVEYDRVVRAHEPVPQAISFPVKSK